MEVWQPQEGQDGSIVRCDAVDCCGQLFTTCLPSGECEPLGLKQPEFKKELAQLVLTSEILVEDCEGHYISYAPHMTQVDLHGRSLQSPRRDLNLDEHLILGVRTNARND